MVKKTAEIFVHFSVSAAELNIIALEFFLTPRVVVRGTENTGRPISVQGENFFFTANVIPKVERQDFKCRLCYGQG
jgi:hypothetical protein